MVSKELQKKRFEILALIAVLSLIFVLFLRVTIPNHIVFGDEGFHSRVSQLMAENKEFPTYLGTNLDKTAFARPPFFHILQAGLLSLFGLNELVIKTLTPFVAVMLGLSVFLLVKRLRNKETGLLATLFLVALPSFVTYSILFYVDIVFTFFGTLSVLLFLLSLKENNKKYWILSAVFFSLAFLTKIVGLLLLMFVAITFIYVMLAKRDESRKDIFKKYILFAFIFLILVSPFIIRNLYYYNAPLCDIRLRFFGNSTCSVTNYVQKYQFPPTSQGTGTESSISNFGIVNFINFAYGTAQNSNQFFIFNMISALGDQFTKLTGLALTSLIFVFGIFGGIVILVKGGDRMGIMLLILLALSTIALYQTGYRTEDAVREILLWAPVLSIISAIYWSEIMISLDKISKYLGVALIIFVLIIGLQSVINKLVDMTPVKQFSPLFFQACDWVKSNLSSDSMLMTYWGYRAGYNCERAVSPAFADIRLSDNPAYIDSFAKQQGITHFFIQKFSISSSTSRDSYSIAFVQLLDNNPQYFEKVYENGPLLQDCVKQGGCDGNIIYKVL